MKSAIAFITCAALITTAFVGLWCLIAFVDLRVPMLHASWILKCVYFASIPISFVAFAFATSRCFRRFDAHAFVGFLVSLVITPILYVIGLTVMVNFKLWLGGGR